MNWGKVISATVSPSGRFRSLYRLFRLQRILRMCFVVVTAIAGGCSSSDTPSCAPSGVYSITAVRSADPGSCPATVQLPFKWTTVEVNSTDQLCDKGTEQTTVGDPKADYCSYVVSIIGSVSSAGITAKASVTFYHCPSVMSGSTCTANYDLLYTNQADAVDAGP